MKKKLSYIIDHREFVFIGIMFLVITIGFVKIHVAFSEVNKAVSVSPYHQKVFTERQQLFLLKKQTDECCNCFNAKQMSLDIRIITFIALVVLILIVGLIVTDVNISKSKKNIVGIFMVIAFVLLGTVMYLTWSNVYNNL